jgi:hypothetical protein
MSNIEIQLTMEPTDPRSLTRGMVTFGDFLSTMGALNDVIHTAKRDMPERHSSKYNKQLQDLGLTWDLDEHSRKLLARHDHYGWRYLADYILHLVNAVSDLDGGNMKDRETGEIDLARYLPKRDEMVETELVVANQNVDSLGIRKDDPRRGRYMRAELEKISARYGETLRDAETLSEIYQAFQKNPIKAWSLMASKAKAMTDAEVLSMGNSANCMAWAACRPPVSVAVLYGAGILDLDTLDYERRTRMEHVIAELRAKEKKGGSK